MNARGLAMALGTFALLLAAGTAAQAGDNNPGNDPHMETYKVTICHATASEKNPYTVNHVSWNAVDNGLNIHWNGHGDHEGDIIPPFGGENGFPGLNYDEAGMAILANGCVVPADEPEPVVETGSVMICHATGTETDPFTVDEVSWTSTDDVVEIAWNGHDDHASDIIPPFLSFEGLNYGTLGQAIWDNDCVVPTQEPDPQTTTVPDDEEEPEVDVLSDTGTPPAPVATPVLSDAGYTG